MQVVSIRLLGCLLVLCAVQVSKASPLRAELKVAAPFMDHMVLQRDAAISVWGSASAMQAVEVMLAEETRSTTADKHGSWRVTFPSRQASSKPLRIDVRAGRESAAIRDVLVGDVWLCAGQSNMEWPVSSSESAATARATVGRNVVRLLKLRGAARGASGSYTGPLLKRMTAGEFCKGSWMPCTTESSRQFSAVGYFFGLALHQELNVPIGLIDVSIGGTPAEAWVRRAALAAHPSLASMVQGNWLENEHLGPWCRERGAQNWKKALGAEQPVPGDDLGPNHSFKPGFMWEAAVAPLTRVPIRGVAWYQGESNAQLDWRVRQHAAVFELLVDDWREQFGRKDLPFVFVQLPGMKRPNWPAFREQQRRFLDRRSGLGMAITIDLGHPTNVHPKRKKPVGERLARAALSLVYGRKDLVRSGPLFRSMEIRGDRAILKFDHVGLGLQTRDGLPLRYFEMAGSDGVFHSAEATILKGDIVVTSSSVKAPKDVRYAWVPFPDRPVNFYNRDDLPASPFSTAAKY